MEERDEKTAADPEVDKPSSEGDIEAHKKNKLIKANEEPGEEDSDVEAHRKKLLK